MGVRMGRPASNVRGFADKFAQPRSVVMPRSVVTRMGAGVNDRYGTTGVAQQGQNGSLQRQGRNDRHGTAGAGQGQDNKQGTTGTAGHDRSGTAGAERQGRDAAGPVRRCPRQIL